MFLAVALGERGRSRDHTPPAEVSHSEGAHHRVVEDVPVIRQRIVIAWYIGTAASSNQVKAVRDRHMSTVSVITLINQ